MRIPPLSSLPPSRFPLRPHGAEGAGFGIMAPGRVLDGFGYISGRLVGSPQIVGKETYPAVYGALLNDSALTCENLNSRLQFCGAADGGHRPASFASRCVSFYC